VIKKWKLRSRNYLLCV